MSKNKLSYEESMKRLEEIIEKLESDDITLEESVALFQEGMILSKECDTILKDAEEKISIISQQPDGSVETKEISEDKLRD